MAKRNVQKRSASKKKQKVKTTKRISNRSNPTFGPVSSITTAPVSIGNSMRGVKAQVIQTSNDSVRIIGRDYALTCVPTGTATGWCLVGGVPLTPAAFVSTTLRSYTQIYNKFKFNACCFHYITSSPTSSNGDILFQVNSNRTDPIANYTAVNFLPYALSKPETIIGPQWTNHSCCVMPKGPTRSLVPGSNNDIDYQAQGEIFVYSKTSTTESPGYVLMDYDITFSELSVNPRAGLLPNGNIIYQPITLSTKAAAYTQNSTYLTFQSDTVYYGGTTITGLNSLPGVKAGDLFKFSIDVANGNFSGWTVSAGTKPTSANLMADYNGPAANVNNTIALKDGYTIYILYESSTNITAYATIAQAYSAINALVAGQTFTVAASPVAYTSGVWISGMASWVGNVAVDNLQQQ